jgi:hypothetical protein
VLTSRHLNDAFDYLDQQERQTRSHLIGIGIVCGLEFKLSGTTIALSKGCGVTSEGYLIVEPHELALSAYRPYALPPDIDYPPLKAGDKPFELWELFENGVPNTTPLGSLPNSLATKALLLFLELRKEGLRTCSPNNCDDKGAQVTATVRRLLIEKADLDTVITAGNALGSGLTASDVDAMLSARLNLPDLRLRRFGVPNTNPVTSEDVYIAFLDMVRAGKLAHATAKALSAAYKAFEPLLKANYPSDPFTGFAAKFGFLDSAPADVTQVRFLQYYADLFDDLLRAYDEFRWKGLDLICACCPDDGLFPRHLMLGLLSPGADPKAANYRNGFLPSPATGACEEQSRDVVQLFTRLVEMAASFTDKPALPKVPAKANLDLQIRITPSTFGCCADELAGKAIPYYYTENRKPPLYTLWNPLKSRRKRANLNLSYNADLYANPAAPAFVTDPLRYDIEPYNFLRIEGHLGKDYLVALRSLLTLKSQYRLPIDVIALRTGAYDDSQPIDPSKQQARFNDLEALYQALRGDLMAGLAEGVMQLYDKAIPAVPGLTLNAGSPKLPLLHQYAPHYGHDANSVGAWYEFYLNRFQTQGYLDVDQDAINLTAVLLVYCTLFNGTKRPDDPVYPHVVAIYYISRLAEIVPPTLAALNYADFENKYQDLMALIRYFRSDAVKSVTADLKNFLPEEEFIDFCEGVLFNCKLDAVKAVHDDYVARIGELRKRQFLSSFLQQHPGIQHKAGVPLGGTFVMVYHGEPAASGSSRQITANLTTLQQQVGQAATRRATGAVEQDLSAAAAVPATAGTVGKLEAAKPQRAGTIAAADDAAQLMKALDNISANRNLVANDDISLIVNWLNRNVPGQATPGSGRTGSSDPASKIVGATVDDLGNGTVIADFFLPYRVAGDDQGVQYVLPKETPTFTATIACTSDNDTAAVTIDAKGGVPPYDVAVDDGAYQALNGALEVAAGNHTIKLRDGDGTETPVQPLTVPSHLYIDEPGYTCTEGKYTATAAIKGGTPPYKVDGKAVSAAQIVTDPTESGKTISVTVMDNAGCSATADFSHTCPPPCTLPGAGIALIRNFRFFLPDANPDDPYQVAKIAVPTFTVEASPGKPIDLSAQVAKILVASADGLAAASFQKLVTGWMKGINDLVARTSDLNQAGKAQWLTLSYKPVAPGRPGLLLIDYFKALKFDIQLVVSYARKSGEVTGRIAYAPDGTTIQIGDARAAIPAYDGTTVDKCSEQPTPKQLCPTKPDFSVKIEPTKLGKVATFTAITSMLPDDLTFVWEVQDALPAIGNGQKFTTTFQSTAGQKLVTVIAINKNGCSVTASDTFNPG